MQIFRISHFNPIKLFLKAILKHEIKLIVDLRSNFYSSDKYYRPKVLKKLLNKLKIKYISFNEPFAYDRIFSIAFQNNINKICLICTNIPEDFIKDYNILFPGKDIYFYKNDNKLERIELPF